jgi:PilZ domain
MDRLQELSIVTMSLPDLGRVSEFKAYVLGVHRTVATLQPVQRAESMWLPPLMENVLMCFPHQGQIVGLKGELRSAEQILFKVTDGVCIPRRRSTRLKLCAPVMLTPLSDDGESAGSDSLACQTQDVSADGVTLEGAAALRPDQLISVTVMLPEDGGTFCAEARVAERGDDGVATVEFTDLDRDDRRRLAVFVTEQVRKRLSIVRSLQQHDDDDWN